MNGPSEDIDEAAESRKRLRNLLSELSANDPLFGMLADLELAAELYYLGLDYDSDTSDIDDIGPF